MIALVIFMLVTGFVFWRVLLKVLPGFFYDSKLKMSVLMVLAIIFMQPFFNWSPAFYIRGLTGDFSILTCSLVIDAGIFCFLNKSIFHQGEKQFILTLVALAGTIFYPLSLGIGLFDPYALGFGNFWLILSLLVIGLYGLIKHWYVVGFSLGMAMLAWSLNVYDSNNLWDYVFDPWTWVYALFFCFKRLNKQIHARYQHHSTNA